MTIISVRCRLSSGTPDDVGTIVLPNEEQTNEGHNGPESPSYLLFKSKQRYPISKIILKLLLDHYRNLTRIIFIQFFSITFSNKFKFQVKLLLLPDGQV